MHGKRDRVSMLESYQRGEKARSRISKMTFELVEHVKILSCRSSLINGLQHLMLRSTQAETVLTHRRKVMRTTRRDTVTLWVSLKRLAVVPRTTTTSRRGRWLRRDFAFAQDGRCVGSGGGNVRPFSSHLCLSPRSLHPFNRFGISGMIPSRAGS